MGSCFRKKVYTPSLTGDSNLSPDYTRPPSVVGSKEITGDNVQLQPSTNRSPKEKKVNYSGLISGDGHTSKHERKVSPSGGKEDITPAIHLSDVTVSEGDAFSQSGGQLSDRTLSEESFDLEDYFNPPRLTKSNKDPGYVIVKGNWKLKPNYFQMDSLTVDTPPDSHRVDSAHLMDFILRNPSADFYARHTQGKYSVNFGDSRSNTTNLTPHSSVVHSGTERTPPVAPVQSRTTGGSGVHRPRRSSKNSSVDFRTTEPLLFTRNSNVRASLPKEKLTPYR